MRCLTGRRTMDHSGYFARSRLHASFLRNELYCARRIRDERGRRGRRGTANFRGVVFRVRLALPSQASHCIGAYGEVLRRVGLHVLLRPIVAFCLLRRFVPSHFRVATILYRRTSEGPTNRVFKANVHRRSAINHVKSPRIARDHVNNATSIFRRATGHVNYRVSCRDFSCGIYHSMWFPNRALKRSYLYGPQVGVHLHG